MWNIYVPNSILFFSAANMKRASDLVHTRCMSHELNLVIADSSENSSITENLHGLVEQTAVF